MNTSDASLMRIERMNYILGAVACAASLATRNQSLVLGVITGVALTCLNFAFLRRLVFRWTKDSAGGVSNNRMMLVLPKMFALMAAVVIALWVLPINAMAFAAGYSVFVLSIMIEAVYGAFVPTSDDSTDSTDDSTTTSTEPRA